MVVDDIVEQLQRRRGELIEVLENQSIELEKQHQIYGAINEIDLFMKILDEHKNDNIGSIRLVRPAEEDDFFTKLFEGLKDKVKRNK